MAMIDNEAKISERIQGLERELNLLRQSLRRSHSTPVTISDSGTRYNPAFEDDYVNGKANSKRKSN